MGRGYSRSRSLSGRETNKLKRERSISAVGDRLRAISEAAVARPTDGGVDVHQRIVRGASTATRMRSASRQSERTVRGLSTFRPSLPDAEDEFDEPSENEDESIRRPTVLMKFKAAGRLTDAALARVIAACVPGATTMELCKLGDAAMADMAAHEFAKAKDEEGKKLKRGSCSPTTVSVNATLCNHAPWSDNESVTLKVGDIVKVHLGVHIDGYPACAARTIVIADPSAAAATPAASTTDADGAAASGVKGPITDSAARAIAASHYAAEAVLRSLRPGMLNADVTDTIARIGNNFGVEACEGVMSTRTKRWISDGMKTIICRRVIDENPQQDVADCTIQPFQVWTVDVAFTDAPSYKLQIPAEDTTIFRRNELPSPPNMRQAAGERLLDEVRDAFLCFPFSIMRTSNPLQARLGLHSLKKLNLVDAMMPLQCRKGFTSTRVCCTVAVTDKRVTIIAGAPALDAAATASLERGLRDILGRNYGFVNAPLGRFAGVEGDDEVEEAGNTKAAAARRVLRVVRRTAKSEDAAAVVDPAAAAAAKKDADVESAMKAIRADKQRSKKSAAAAATAASADSSADAPAAAATATELSVRRQREIEFKQKRAAGKVAKKGVDADAAAPTLADATSGGKRKVRRTE